MKRYCIVAGCSEPAVAMGDGKNYCYRHAPPEVKELVVEARTAVSRLLDEAAAEKKEGRQ